MLRGLFDNRGAHNSFPSWFEMRDFVALLTMRVGIEQSRINVTARRRGVSASAGSIPSAPCPASPPRRHLDRKSVV